MGEPVDLAALVAEPDGEPFEFIWDDEIYTLPADLDIRGAAALSAGRLEDGLRTLLGPEQWTRLQEAPSTFGARHLEALMAAYGEHLGVGLGESPASTVSPPITAKRSRPTSSAITASRSRRSAAAS